MQAQIILPRRHLNLLTSQYRWRGIDEESGMLGANEEATRAWRSNKEKDEEKHQETGMKTFFCYAFESLLFSQTQSSDEVKR